MRPGAILLAALAACRPAPPTPPAVDSAPPAVATAPESLHLSTASAPVITPPLRALCDTLVLRARAGSPRDTVRAIPDSTTWYSDADHPACGVTVTGVGHDSLPRRTELRTWIPRADLGFDSRMAADGPDGSAYALRRPGVLCIVDEERDAGIDTETEVDSGATDWFRHTILCTVDLDPPPDTGPIDFDPLFDTPRGGHVGMDGACYPLPAYTVITRTQRPLPGSRILVRPGPLGACSADSGAGDFRVPDVLLADYLGVKDSVIFLEGHAGPTRSQLILIDLRDHHQVFHGDADALSNFISPAEISLWRRFPRETADPRCDRGGEASIDTLYYLNIRTGRLRSGGRTHCPDFR